VIVAPGALYSTRHMKKALTNTAATTRLTIDPAIFSVLTDARPRRRSKKIRQVARCCGRRVNRLR
jgi:hypothetical protein